MKLKRFILGTLLFFSLVPLCIFGVFSLYEINLKIDDMTDRNLTVISKNQIANIQKFADERKSQMEKVANYNLTRDAILYSLGESDELFDRSYLDNLLDEQKHYSTFVVSVSVLDRNFHVVGSSEKYIFGEISQLKEIDERFHVGDFLMGNVYERTIDNEKKRLVPAYIGVYEEDGELIGYISEELDTAYFNELRLNMDSLASGTFYLLDGTNTIITAGNTTQKDSLTEFVTESNQRSDFHEKWIAIDHTKNPSGKIYYTYNNEKYITYYSNVENTEWSIRVTENLSAQKKDMNSYSLLFIFILGIFVLALIIVQNFVAHKIIEPIQSAMSVFDQIQRTQDYSLRIPVKSSDEMGKLSVGINNLLSYIEKENLQEKSIQSRLRTEAESDPLTGVKNKKAIEQYAMEMVQISSENSTQITIGFLDIDNFRDFNTRYGHQIGDSVIRYVAQTLQKNIGGEVGRIGGDEFTFCYAGVIDEEALRQHAAQTLKHLCEDYIHPENNMHIPITCSLGIVTVKNGNLDYTSLIRLADQAMYQAKDAGKNTYVLMTV